MQRGQQVLARLRVEADRGLVHQEHRRPVQTRPHQLHLAAVATREFAHLAVEFAAQAQALAIGGHALLRERARQPVQVGLEEQVAPHAQVEIERDLLEHHADVAQRRGGGMAQRMAGHLDLALVGREEPGEHLEQGGLAGPVRAQQRDELPGAQIERQGLQGRPGAIALGQASGFQQGGRTGCLGHVRLQERKR
jgi:hypothetical protein